MANWMFTKLREWSWQLVKAAIIAMIMQGGLLAFGFTPGTAASAMLAAAIVYSEAYGWLVLLTFALILTYVFDLAGRQIWSRISSRFSKEISRPIDYRITTESFGNRAYLFKGPQDDPVIYDFGNATITNISPKRPISLHIALQLKSKRLINTSINAGGTFLRASIEHHGLAAEATKQHGLTQFHCFELPIGIEPSKSATGRLVFLYDSKSWGDFVNPEERDNQLEKFFLIKDLISGKIITRPAKLNESYRGKPNA